MAYGTFSEGEKLGEQRSGQTARYLALAAAGAMALAGVALLASSQGASRPAALSSMDRNDGTDALVNAILVARGDSMPTKMVANRLNIDPQLPFRGTTAYQGPRHSTKASTARLSQARLQSLEAFCSDPEDCMRNNDYFTANAEFHQAARDMTMGPSGVAMPPSLPTGIAWCPSDNPDC